MEITAYPAQEPLNPVAKIYHEEVMRRGATVGPVVESRYGDDPYQCVAIFPSTKPDGRLLVFIHGGGWTNGYKEWMSFMAPAYTGAGVTFVTIGYRLAPGHVFPVGYEDVADGFLHVMSRVAQHGGDPQRAFVGGHSAGGHYAALLATRSDWWRARGVPENPVRGCLPVSGVYRFGEGSGMSMRPRFLGLEGIGNERRASPVEDITDATPFLMAHGDRDFPHLMTQAEEMERVLRACAVPVRRLVLRNADHFIASYLAGEAGSAFVDAALQFMGSGRP